MQKDQGPTPHQRVEIAVARHILAAGEGNYDPLVSFVDNDVVVAIAKEVQGHHFVARIRIPSCASHKRVIRDCEVLLTEVRKQWFATASEFGWIQGAA